MQETNALQDKLRQAALLIKDADVILVATGAGGGGNYT